MKNVLFLLLVVLMSSCGKSNEEQLLYDYQSKGVKEVFNTNLEELDFKINSVEKVGEIKASDSIKTLKGKLAVVWFGENVSKKEKDTLSFDYVVKELDKLTETYQSIIISNINLDEDYKNYEYEKKRKSSIETSVIVKSWGMKFNEYSKNPNVVLSSKYKASYSIMNPLLKLNQSFDKIYYTNASQTKFIQEEEVE